MPVIKVPDDCRGCAACCKLIVELTPDVYPDTDGAIAEEFTTEHSSGKLVLDRTDNGDCVMLDPDTRTCTIYERRPQICRDFGKGNAPCMNAVHRYIRITQSELDELIDDAAQHFVKVAAAAGFRLTTPKPGDRTEHDIYAEHIVESSIIQRADVKSAIGRFREALDRFESHVEKL